MEQPPRTRATRMARAAAAARSSLRRYPRELMASLRGEAAALPLAQSRIDFDQLVRERLAAAWVGHATVLVRLGNQTILTDPVFSSRIGMQVGSRTIGPARLLPPAAEIEHLPKIDLVLLSHAHFDHLDKPSLRRLASGPARGAVVVTADRTRTLIPDGFGEVVQLAWGRQVRIGDIRIAALRPRHWGARAALDRFRRYNAYLLEHGLDRVLFAGDTAMTDAFDVVPQPALSVFGIGAYESWEGAHATPEQVWAMFVRAAHPEGKLLPMHHSTFDLGERSPDEPLRRLIAAAGDRADRIVCREVGGVWRVGRSDTGQRGEPDRPDQSSGPSS